MNRALVYNAAAAKRYMVPFMTAQHAESDEPPAKIPARELRRLRARQILGVPVRRGEEEYVTTDEVRRRLGLPR